MTTEQVLRATERKVDRLRQTLMTTEAELTALNPRLSSAYRKNNEQLLALIKRALEETA